MKKSGIYAKPVIFQYTEGYMVIQYIHGKNISSQFVSEEDYGTFCEAIGCEPELINDEK